LARQPRCCVWLLGNGGWSQVRSRHLGYERQTNFVLLNDGTGRIYVALHDQFLNYSKLVSNFLIENKMQFANALQYFMVMKITDLI
jgi:hypothetical protein